MVRPLSRKTDGGVTYARPKAIEAAIASARRLESDELRRRAALGNREDPEYLPSECLVHLIRDAGRRVDSNTACDLMQWLVRRCTQALFKRVPDRVPGAEEIRETVLARLNVLLLEDIRHGDRDDLDFYEVRFNQAFCRALLDVKELVSGRLRREVPQLPAYAEVHEGEDGDERAAGDCSPDAAPGEKRDVLALRTLESALNHLPRDQREAVRLHYFEDLKVESNDSDEMTVAKALGVTGRTVRTRLAKALATLHAKLEPDHG